MFPNLRAEMARKSLTPQDMAPRLGMNPRTLGNKLSGKSEFTWGEVRKLRSEFFPNCSYEYLLERENENTA